MHAPHAAASRRSHWTGLDALVLEEIEALQTSAPRLRHARPAPFAGFASDEEFLMGALRYLAVHPDPGALVARLAAGFQAAPKDEAEGPSGAGEAAAAAAPDEAADAAAPSEPLPDDGKEEDRS
jgi:hypothetical protein